MGAWFSKRDSEDYEQVLAALAMSIASRQTRLSEIRLRERRATLLFTIYTLAIWGLYVMIWYLGWLPRVDAFGRVTKLREAVRAIPVFIGPIIVLFMRRIVQWWYTRIGNAEEKTLKTLVAQQRTKIEEIKKKTNYYSTRNLIERYDGPPGTPREPNKLRQRPVASPAQESPEKMQVKPESVAASAPRTPHKPPPLPIDGTAQPTDQAVVSHSIFSPTPLHPQPPPVKHWYDRLADALLGDDSVAPGGAAADSRYALICEKCSSHNGLVKESQWEDAQYICPRCGHFNASPRSKAHQSHPAHLHQGIYLHPEVAESRPRGRRSPSPVPSSPLHHSEGQPSISPQSSPPSHGKNLQSRDPPPIRKDADQPEVGYHMDTDG